MKKWYLIAIAIALFVLPLPRVRAQQEEPFLVRLKEGMPIGEALQTIAPLRGDLLYVFFDFGGYTGFYRAPAEIDNLASVEAYERKNHNAYLADLLSSLEKDIGAQPDTRVRAAIQAEISRVLFMRDRVERDYVPVTGFVLLADASILEKAGSILPDAYFDPAILDNPDEPQWTYGTGHGELLEPQTWYNFYIRTAPGTDPHDKARLRGVYVFNYAEWCDKYFWCQGEVSGEQALLIWPWYWIPLADKQWTY